MMAKDAQRRAIESYRARLSKRGVVRFELQALDTDRTLLRALACKLIAHGPEAQRIRHSLVKLRPLTNPEGLEQLLPGVAC